MEAILKEAERWVWYPQSAERIEEDVRLLVHMPEHWGFSIVQRSSVGDERLAREMIERTIQEAREAGRKRLAWEVSEVTDPPHMGELLVERGFEVSEELEVLAYELGSGSEPRLPRMSITPGTTAELVRNVEGLREVHRIGAEVFPSHRPSEKEIAEYAGQLEKLERWEQSEVPSALDELLTLSFLAFFNEVTDKVPSGRKPIASAGVTLAGRVARMWGGSTMEEYRGHGAYGVLVTERCRAAHAFGVTLALVKARVGTSGPILSRAGFERAGTERRYEMEIS